MALLLVSPRYSPPNDVRSIGNPDHKLVDAEAGIQGLSPSLASGPTLHTRRCAPINSSSGETNRAHRRNSAANEQRLRYATPVL
jgi:hypothetical protein